MARRPARRRIAGIPVIAACALASLCATANAQQVPATSGVAAVARDAGPGDASSAGPARAMITAVRPGDVLRVTVWRKPELSGDFAVAADGTLRHPLYREVEVAGVPAAMVAERLRVYLTRYEVAPQLVVEPLLRVAVVGEVRQPNLYTLSPETTIIEAIALAGGLSERGRMDRVHLRRGGREWLLNLDAAHAGLVDRPVESGDRITVEARRDVLRQYIGPIASLAAAVVSIVSVATR